MRCTTLQSGTLSAATTRQLPSTSTTTAPCPPTRSAPSHPCGARLPPMCCCRYALWFKLGCPARRTCWGGWWYGLLSRRAGGWCLWCGVALLCCLPQRSACSFCVFAVHAHCPVAFTLTRTHEPHCHRLHHPTRCSLPCTHCLDPTIAHFHLAAASPYPAGVWSRHGRCVEAEGAA